MGKCIHHPDRESAYICQKHNYYVCDDCLRCEDPKIYCKFRSRCPIRFIEKNNQDEADALTQLSEKTSAEE
ncbi:MAG: hypothetical protein Q7U02_05675 [Desulfosalsimonadaceae bacterium]|nr:hypothetical protein [Desulfosalsimonadaceae bacterium]